MKFAIIFGFFIALVFSSSILIAQVTSVTVSGTIKDSIRKEVLPYANVIIKKGKDSTFVTGSITNEEGRFTLSNIKPGDYFLEVILMGYTKKNNPVTIGSLSDYLELSNILLSESGQSLNEIQITGKQDEVSGKMDKKVFSVADNISQSGGSVLESMKNLPGVTVGQDGKVQLRGSDKITVLIDGKQTALTGFGSQSGLDNIPASAIERIEIINNPSAKYDANGNAGIINIIYKKEKKEGLNGKVGMAAGLGALWVKQENYPAIRAQYQNTPKVNPSLSLNYHKKKINIFFQGDYLYTRTLNKNEFVDRYYNNGDTVKQQTKRNRTTTIAAVKTGIDWNLDENNMLTFSGLFSSEKILDRGDEPFFDGSLSERLRLWQFLEDELKTTVTSTANWQHKFKQPGRLLNMGLNYTFHRENEKYFFTNIMPAFTGYDAFKLLSDENVFDLNIDYIKLLKYGRFESGLKFRRRYIPTNMQFIPGLNSPLDTNAGGWADYSEVIPALYGNYAIENKKVEMELGLRVEYVGINYTVNPEHSTYKSSGYNYTQPFPNIRLAYKLNDHNKVSAFYTRRVDRPNEVDIRIFPKYDDAEIIKVGNPALRPQFTNSFELGYKTSWPDGYLYLAAYHKITDATITRIASVVPGSTIIYNIFQNAGRSYNTGFELMLSQNIQKLATLSLNVNGYQNTIDAFTVENKYPVTNTFTVPKQELISGNAKVNGVFHFPKRVDLQITGVYLAPDIIPQGKVGARFSLDIGIKKTIQNGKGELFLNASDLLNTMRVKKEIQGDGFRYVSTDYYETQVIRAGYSYKF
jgi:outer membrane receptor protein involved in Fe transport